MSRTRRSLMRPCAVPAVLPPGARLRVEFRGVTAQTVADGADVGASEGAMLVVHDEHGGVAIDALAPHAFLAAAGQAWERHRTLPAGGGR